MKKIIVNGNVGRNAENKETFTSFSLAVSSGTKANPKTDWLEITCFGKTAEIAQQHIKRGDKVLIDGVPSAGAYVNKEGKAVAVLKVIANNIEFISKAQNKLADIDDIDFGG